MQIKLSNLLLTKVIPPHISKLNTNARVNKVYKYSKNAVEAIQHVLHDLNNWYVNVIGLAEVKKYQDRVVQIQAKLLETQEKRREVSKQLVDIRSKSYELQDQIHKHKREDDLEKFLDLVRQETEILRKERDINSTFAVYDREERDLFTVFTNAVRESHEKQRAQLEYTKYLGLAMSIVGSLITFCYSTLRKHELKSFIEEKLSVSLVSGTGNYVTTNENHNNLFDKMTALCNQNTNILMNSHKELKNMIKTLNSNIIKIYNVSSKNGKVVQDVNMDFQDNFEAAKIPNLLVCGLITVLFIGILKCVCG